MLNKLKGIGDGGWLAVFIAIVVGLYQYVWSAFTLHGAGITFGTLFEGGLADFGAKLVWSGSVFNYIAAAVVAFGPWLLFLIPVALGMLASKFDSAGLGVATAVVTLIISIIVGVWGFVWAIFSKMAVIALVGNILGAIGLISVTKAITFGTTVNMVLGAIWGIVSALTGKKDNKITLTVNKNDE